MSILSNCFKGEAVQVRLYCFKQVCTVIFGGVPLDIGLYILCHHMTTQCFLLVGHDPTLL